MFRYVTGAVLLAMLIAPPAESQDPARSITVADLADLALPAPLVAHVRIRDAARLRGERATGVAAGMSRFYVEADILSLIKGPAGTPGRLSYLVDLPNDPDGRPVRLRDGDQYLVLASIVPGRSGELRLVARDAQLPFNPAIAQQVRALLRDAAQPEAAPAIVGIGKAFHVPGALSGEGETQIFLLAAGGRPVSLSVLRRPGAVPTWAVALSEIVDEAAAEPAPGSLLWYRLACNLPPVLPPASFDGSSASEAATIRADYAFIKGRLGPCTRNRR